MATRIVMTDNSGKILTQMDGNVDRALEALGVKAQNLILYQMQRGYGKPIRKTGDLQRDVNYSVDAAAQSVTAGNSLDYANPVHDGTSKMEGRPYIRDALTGENHIRQLRQVAEAYLQEGFDK